MAINMDPTGSTTPMSFDEFLAEFYPDRTFITDPPIIHESAASNSYTDDGASGALIPATAEIPKVLPSAAPIPATTDILQNLAASTSKDVATISPGLMFTTVQWEIIHKMAEELRTKADAREENNYSDISDEEMETPKSPETPWFQTAQVIIDPRARRALLTPLLDSDDEGAKFPTTLVHTKTTRNYF